MGGFGVQDLNLKVSGVRPYCQYQPGPPQEIPKGIYVGSIVGLGGFFVNIWVLRMVLSESRKPLASWGGGPDQGLGFRVWGSIVS